LRELVSAAFWTYVSSFCRLESGENSVGDGGCFYGGADVVDAEDVGSGEDGCDVGCGGRVDASVDDRLGLVLSCGAGAALGQRVAQKTLAGGSDKDGQVEVPELFEVCQQGVVFVEALAEAEARIEDDLVARDAGGQGGFEALCEFGKDQRKDLIWGERREGWPLLRASAGVHQDGSAAKRGAGGGHALVPEMAADIVDDLDSSFDAELRGAGVEGVDGEDGIGSLSEDGFDDREDAGLLLFSGERSRVGPSGFAADVEDVRAFVEHLEGVGDGADRGVFGRVEVATVGEGVGRNVEDAHEDGSLAQGKGAGAEVPVEVWARREGHEGILAVSCQTCPTRSRICPAGHESFRGF